MAHPRPPEPPSIPDDRVPFGRRGEDAAARYLEGRGHVVLARRFRTAQGEVDLVTRAGAHLYFVEVKTRRSIAARDAWGGGLHAIGWRKQRRLSGVAEVFVERQRLTGLTPHLAVATVEVVGATASVRFLPDAFDGS